MDALERRAVDSPAHQIVLVGAWPEKVVATGFICKFTLFLLLDSHL